MSSDRSLRRHANSFGLLLDRIDSPRRAPLRVGGVRGDRTPWLNWPRQECATGAGAATATAAYADNPGASEPLDRCDEVANSIRERFDADFDAAAGIDDLRRLRRRYALLLHPDRAAPAVRTAAEKFMAEINAAIDKAMGSRASSRKS